MSFKLWEPAVPYNESRLASKFHPKFHIDSGALGKRPGNMAAVSGGVKENKIEHHMMHPHPMQVS